MTGRFGSNVAADAALHDAPRKIERLVGERLDVKSFVANFEVISEAAGGCDALRELVRDLAIHGRLSGTPTGSDGLPHNWRWATPDELSANKRNALAIGPFGSNLLKDDYRDSGVPLVFVRDITSGVFGGPNTRYVTPEKAAQLAAHRAEAGDLLITKMGSPPGDTAIYPSDRPPAIVTADCIKLSPKLEITSASYLALAIGARSVKEKILEITMGVAHQKVSLRRFRVVPIPLPPLAEQNRIVAKVHQLMALCDELEARQTKKRAIGTRLTKSALEALTTAEGPDEFDAAWKRVVENFDVLIGRADNIAALRTLILELAVRGLLFRTQEAAGAGNELFVAVREHRRRMLADKRIRGVAGAPVLPEEEPFSIPKAWAWARFGDLGDWGAGATPNRARPDYYGGNMPWFKSGELNDGNIDTAQETVSEKALAECSLRVNQPGDVLVAMYGATIGKTAILRVTATTNQAVCACTCFPGVDNEYLLLLLRAFKSTFVGQGAGGAQPNISKEKIVATPAPLPPLNDQRRIVAKVEQLMKVCDQLEERLGQAEDVASKVVQAVVQELVG